jgi:glycolate oxidase FAD binding subunit
MTAPTTASGIEALRALLPPDRACPPEQYMLDGVTPALALRPQTREETAALLAAADTAGLVVSPLGARTSVALGRPLATYDVALDTTGLDRVVEYEPNDLTVTVEAGMTLARLQQVLGEHGQYLPADPPPDDRVTIGGLLATARPGAWRGHVPGQRDLVLGVRVATPEGMVTHSGGRVVKNVSGYDLHRMHTGALGAFGVIVEATFKLAPLPAGTRTFAVQCATLEQAGEIAFRLWDEALPLRALSLLAPGAAQAAGLAVMPHVLVECMGGEAALARCTEAITRAAVLGRANGGDALESDAAWRTLRLLAGGGAAGSHVVLRIGVPSSRVAATVEAATAAGYTAWGHLAAGSVLAHAPLLDATAVHADAVHALREQAHAVGGFLQVESASAALRLAVDPFASGDLGLLRALKREFDPRGTLNRGRWHEDV